MTGGSIPERDKANGANPEKPIAAYGPKTVYPGRAIRWHAAPAHIMVCANHGVL